VGARAGRWIRVDRRGTSPRLYVWPDVLPFERTVVPNYAMN
jgi:hypothetical protein